MSVKIITEMSDQGLITKMGISMKNSKKFFFCHFSPDFAFFMLNFKS